MKILITGAGGWLGSELTENILKEGNFVRAFVLFTSTRLNELKNKYVDKLEIIEGDICDDQLVNESLKDIDIVYHLAAKVHSLPKNKKDEEDFFKINTEGSKILFNNCINNNVKRVIFYSTVSIYGESDYEINSESKVNPVTAYGKSKLEAEKFGMKLFKEKGLPITIIEPVTVYGGDDVGNFEKLKSLSLKGILLRFGNGENKKTVIYYKDLISMTIKIANSNEAIGKRIICGTEHISINNINEVFRELGNKRKIRFNINNSISNFCVRTFNLIGVSLTKKIARQITVLKSNNIYDLSEAKQYIKNYKLFKEYYGGEN